MAPALNASSYRGGAILFLRLFSISFVPFPFHYNECFFVHQFGKGGRKAYKSTTNSNHKHPIAPNLPNRNFSFSQPNQAWVGDITYVPTDEGWLYLAAVMDLCTRKVVGYAFSDRIDKDLTLAALNMAAGREQPSSGLIFHSDRVSQYAANAYQKRLGALQFH